MWGSFTVSVGVEYSHAGCTEHGKTQCAAPTGRGSDRVRNSRTVCSSAETRRCVGLQKQVTCMNLDSFRHWSRVGKEWSLTGLLHFILLLFCGTRRVHSCHRDTRRRRPAASRRRTGRCPWLLRLTTETSLGLLSAPNWWLIHIYIKTL